MPGRKYSSATQYRYGFNGKEEDDEVKGDGNQQDYGMRIYDTRLGRFLSIDPLMKDYPELTTYQFASNTPIQAIDLDGLEMARPKEFDFNSWANKPLLTLNTEKTEKPKVALTTHYWNGVKAGYKETKASFSLSSIKRTYNNALGTMKDVGNMMIAKPGAAQNFSNRVTGFSMGISNSITQPINFVVTMPTRTSEENAFGMGYYSFQIGLMYAASRFFTGISEVPSSGTTLFEDLYRVQGGGSKTRFVVTANEVSIVGNDMLFVNIGQESRAMTFLAKRGEDAVLLKFRIDKAFVDKLRKEAVPQNVGSFFPNRPQIVDATQAPDQFGIPMKYFQELLNSIDASSLQIIKKK